MKRLFLTLIAGAAASVAPAQSGTAPFTIHESGQGFMRLQEAVDAIGGGAGTILIAPGHYRQCAVQEAGQVSYVATDPGKAVFDGVACEGKAALVLRGDGATVAGITFANIRVPDENGAGIRLQQGDLLVRESLFLDSESGILAHSDPDSTIRIERSTFSGLGYCASDCAHSIYIGNYGRLIVDRARFERGAGGHYVKMRGAVIEVLDSSFDDSGGKATNYMIDLPNGATGRIGGNTFVQGADKENYTAMIVVAAEEIVHPSAGLAVTGNVATLAPEARPTSFVVDFTGDPLTVEDNRLGEDVRRFERR